MSRGPAPKPTVLKQLAGNPGKRPLNGEEPQIASGAPTCPRHLSAAARREWKRVVHILADAGVVTQVDRAILSLYCQAYGRWVDAENALAKGDLTEETPNGMVVQSAYLQIATKAMENVKRFAEQLGMTPASRSRIHVEKAEAKKSLAEMLFEGVSDGRGN